LAAGLLSAQTPQPRPVQSVVIKITPRGLEPPTLNLRPGPTLVTVLHRSGENVPPVLALDREQGARVATLPFPERQTRLRSIVDLTPGRFQMSIVGRPTLRIDVNVE